MKVPDQLPDKFVAVAVEASANTARKTMKKRRTTLHVLEPPTMNELILITSSLRSKSPRSIGNCDKATRQQSSAAKGLNCLGYGQSPRLAYGWITRIVGFTSSDNSRHGMTITCFC